MRRFVIMIALILLVTGCERAPKEQVEVPNVVGLYDVMILQSLVPAGFAIGRTYTFDPAYANEEVISQSPAPGTIVDKGSTITVTINRDPDVIYSKSYGNGWYAYSSGSNLNMIDRWSIINLSKKGNIMSFLIINYTDADGSITFGPTGIVSLSDQYTNPMAIQVIPDRLVNSYRVSIDLDKIGGETPPWIYFQFDCEYNGQPIKIKLDFDQIRWKLPD